MWYNIYTLYGRRYIMSQITTYARKVKQAYENYITNKNVDIEKCENVCKYVDRIDDLNPDEKKYLDEFISENSFIEIHLSNLYSDKVFKRYILNLIPMKAIKPEYNFNKIKGDFSFIKNKPKEKIKVRAKHRGYTKKA